MSKIDYVEYKVVFTDSICDYEPLIDGDYFSFLAINNID